MGMALQCWRLRHVIGGIDLYDAMEDDLFRARRRNLKLLLFTVVALACAAVLAAMKP